MLSHNEVRPAGHSEGRFVIPRVQFAWRRLQHQHLVRDQGVGGSNPLSPTIIPKQLIELARTPFLEISTFGSVWVQLANLPPSEPLLSLPLAMREYTFLV